MTGALAVTADHSMESQVRNARWRFRILLAVASFYLLLTFAAPILIDDAGLLLLKPHGWWSGVDRYWLCGCVALVAGWMALGPGPLPKRAVKGLIGILWLMLAWLLGLTMSPNWKPELELTALICAAAAIATFLSLATFRRFTGKSLVRVDGTSEVRQERFQYSLTALFIATLLICMTFAIYRWVDARYRNYTADPNVQLLWYLGWRRRQLLESSSREALGAILVCAACFPVFVSQRKRSFTFALVFIVLGIALRAALDPWARSGVFYPLWQGTPLVPWAIDNYLIPILADLATIALCLLSAAVTMRCLGCPISKA